MMASGIKIAGMGMLMGIVHVLTGPDHLSALATLSSNVDAMEAFICGFQWGFGHSIGIILVGAIFIMADQHYGGGNGDDDNNDDEAVVDIPQGLETFLESIVGIAMLTLGIYGVITAVRPPSSSQHDRTHVRPWRGRYAIGAGTCRQPAGPSS